MNKIKVSVAQITPEFLDRDATIEKAISVISEAAANGAKLIVFPEAFIPGYPEWVWTNAPGKKSLTHPLYEKLLEQSVSPMMNPCSCSVMLQTNPKSSSSWESMKEILKPAAPVYYNSILYIDDNGRLLGKHRKLVPTSGERLVHAMGDGSTLETFDTSDRKNRRTDLLGKLYATRALFHVRPGRADLCGSDLGLWRTLGFHAQGILPRKAVCCAGCMHAHESKRYPDGDWNSKNNTMNPKEWINPGNSIIVNPKGEIIAGP